MAWNTKKPATTTTNIQTDDFSIPNPPSESISTLSVNPAGNMLIAGSWDNSISCYELQLGAAGNVTNAIPQVQMKHDGPILCSDIAADGITVFSGGCDRVVKMWNPTQGPTSAQTIGTHDQPIKCLKFIPDMNVVVTGSWDKTMKIWDCRQSNPAATMPFNERVYCMDVKGQAMVVGTADKMLHVFDIRESRKISEFISPIPYQTRCVSIFHDKNGFAVGSIEGRVAIEYFSELSKKTAPGLGQTPPRDPKGLNFVFKCHRHKREENANATITNTDVYSVNDIAFHPYNSFCTAGSDGTLGFWDKDARHRLRSFDRFKNEGSISCATFNAQGTLLFYAVSYDWSKGVDGVGQSNLNNIFVHLTAKDEIQPKPKK